MSACHWLRCTVVVVVVPVCESAECRRITINVIDVQSFKPNNAHREIIKHKSERYCRRVAVTGEKLPMSVDEFACIRGPIGRTYATAKWIFITRKQKNVNIVHAAFFSMFYIVYSYFLHDSIGEYSFDIGMCALGTRARA